MKLTKEELDAIQSIQVGEKVKVVITSDTEVVRISSVVTGIFELEDETVFRFACGRFPASTKLDDETGVSILSGRSLYTEKYGQPCTIEKL
jgi:hypothetical protein